VRRTAHRRIAGAFVRCPWLGDPGAIGYRKLLVTVVVVAFGLLVGHLLGAMKGQLQPGEATPR